VLIRGGENVPWVEIENLLTSIRAVAAVAVSANPDARLGERGCAFIIPKPGNTIEFAAMQAYLAECQMAKQFWPERVELWRICLAPRAARFRSSKLKEFAASFATVDSGPRSLRVANTRPFSNSGYLSLLIGKGRVSPVAETPRRLRVIAGFEQNDLLTILDHQCRINAGSVDQGVEFAWSNANPSERRGPFLRRMRGPSQAICLGNDAANQPHGFRPIRVEKRPVSSSSDATERPIRRGSR